MQLIDMVLELPLSIQIPAAVVAVVLAGWIVWMGLLRSIFRRNLFAAIANPDVAERRLRAHYRPTTILMRSRLIEAVARRGNREAIALSGIDRLWVERLRRLHRTRDAKRVLAFASDTGLFTVFLVALKKRSVAAQFKKWLDDSGDLLMLRRVALTGAGDDFDGATAHDLLSDRLDEVREMTGDPEWKARYLAVKIILHDTDPRAERALWDAFLDANAIVRAAVVREFHPADQDRLYEALFDRYLQDPVFEVRASARLRIARQFPERLRLEPKKLSEVEAFHVLQLLQDGSSEDEAVAFHYIEHKSRELRLPAAIYLQKIGALNRIFRQASLGDRDAFDRTEARLRAAAEVNVSGFLSDVNLENSASLMLAARLLQTIGDASVLVSVAERAFALPEGEAIHADIVETVLDAISRRGGEESLRLMARELERAHRNESRAAGILTRIPARGEGIFAPVLLRLLKDDATAARTAVESALVALPTAALLPELLAILEEGRERHSHQVRISAVRVIGRMQLPFCLQYLIENLPTLRPEDAREFTATIAGFAGKAFEQRVRQILDGPDAIMRAAMILSLPATGDKSYLKTIRETVSDSDPDVRIAAVWALHLYGESRSVNQAIDLLRDPVERVRREAATALGVEGTAATLQKIHAMIGDENEVNAVKRSAIEGLGRSQEPKSIALLAKILMERNDWDDDVVAALAAKRTRKQVTAIIEELKDAEPTVRAKLTRVFRMMGREGEQAMVDLLQEDIASLRPSITAVLDDLGYIEATIRMLSNRDADVRRSAATALAAIGTAPAFRGIVLAARDPDPEVRVQVTRALEKLATASGKKILAQLEEDPDRKVRKYTQWAMERVRSKSL